MKPFFEQQAGAELSTAGNLQHDAARAFKIWPAAEPEVESRIYAAATAWQAAESRAREDYDPSIDEYAYGACDCTTGERWLIRVAVVPQPSFVAVEARTIPMPAASHVLWGGRVLCEDLRLRGVPRDWPAGQRWLSLKDLAEGAAAPPDRCEECWRAAPGLITGLRLIGAGQ